MHHHPTRLAACALLALATAAVPARADLYTIDYSGTVYASDGTAPPAVGSTVYGRFTLDTQASAYLPDPSAPPSPNAGYYQLPVPPHGGTITTTTWSGVGAALAVEVHDDDTVLSGTGAPTDIIGFGAGVAGLKFALILLGDPGSFSGTGPPEAAVIDRFWTSGEILVLYQVPGGGQARARLDTLSVSAVPEAPSVQSTLAGLAVLCLAVHRRRRRSRGSA